MINRAQLAYAMNIETRAETQDKYEVILATLELDDDFCFRPEEFIREIMFLLNMRSAALSQMALNDYMTEG